MIPTLLGLLLGCSITPFAFSGPGDDPLPDWRHVAQGAEIPDEAYCDQPRLAVLGDGTWVCVLTTGNAHEGQGEQHVVCTRSTDQGESWSPLVDIEPADSVRTASYAVVARTPFDRVYAFYTYNGDGVTKLPDGGKMRYDTQGWLCYRFSDDAGRTWSERQRVPLRVTAADRGNQWGGELQLFWMIGKPITTTDGSVMFALTKLGRYFLEEGEGWFVRCDNLNTERDPDELHWEILPEGDHGLRHPEWGTVQEEFNLAPLSDGGLFCLWRTTRGFMACSFSEDGGRSWTAPERIAYEPGGHVLPHPRACPKVWRCVGGKYLLWFHNHHGRDFQNRNPAWLVGGVEENGRIRWSQPEVLLYSNDGSRFSYPDLVEANGRYWIAETQKTVARVHELDATLLAGLWGQLDAESPGGVTTRGLAGFSLQTVGIPTEVKNPPLDASPGGGFSIGMWLSPDALESERILVDGRDETGRGVLIRVIDGEDGEALFGPTLRLELSDGARKSNWSLGPERFQPGRRHHVVLTVDGGPRLITAVIDGKLDDGDPERRPFGWSRFAERMTELGRARFLRVAPEVVQLRLYDRPLRTCEAVANHRAGPPAEDR